VIDINANSRWNAAILQKKRGSGRFLFFVVTDLIIHHKELIG